VFGGTFSREARQLGNRAPSLLEQLFLPISDRFSCGRTFQQKLQRLDIHGLLLSDLQTIDDISRRVMAPHLAAAMAICAIFRCAECRRGLPLGRGREWLPALDALRTEGSGSSSILRVRAHSVSVISENGFTIAP
jgi:hypothetical protein